MNNFRNHPNPWNSSISTDFQKIKTSNRKIKIKISVDSIKIKFKQHEVLFKEKKLSACYWDSIKDNQIRY